MKTLFAVIISLFATVAQADIGPTGRSTNVDNSGAVKAGTLEKHFINVINGSGGTLTSGSLVVWDATADDGATVTTSIVNNATPACVVVGSASGSSTSCLSGKLCKCQTYGYAAVRFGVHAGSAAAAGPVYISRDRAGYVEATPYASIGASSEKIGMFYDAEVATNEAAEVFLKLR